MSITPAPWQVCDRSDGTVEVLSSHGCGIVCVVGGTGDEIAANAAMLASAPELLVACKRLASELDMVQWKDGCGYTLCGSPVSMRDLLHNVITKAEGRDE